MSTPSRSRSTDVRGNVTENELLVNTSFVTSRQTVPHATNKPFIILRYGVELQTVSVSAVTNTIAYDYLGRKISNIDGRGNATHIEYDDFSQRSASIDALGNRTTYGYDQFGNLVAVTNPLGNAIVYEYDLRGRKTYEGGATYPVRYTYDVFGNKTTMMTYRDESKGRNSGDVTTWLYDEASGVMTNKVYADGKGPTYGYTLDGKLSRRTWARGIVTDYSYDGWGNLTNTVYSDDTPTVSLKYDALGRQIEARDAAGVTTFIYDSFGSVTNETVIGVAGTNTIIRYWDEFGRMVGYALNGIRQTIIGYEPDKGRISTMETPSVHSPTSTQNSNLFQWTYLDGSDLKTSLSYPNGLTASWSYDAAGQLLQVCNATPTNVISQYDYTYDAAGRRVSCMKSGNAFTQNDTLSYGYNEKSELTNAVAVVDSYYHYAYNFDGIGNRESSSERGTNFIYTANQLNQYTAIDDFAPQYDDDGNQVLVKTSTGVWSVSFDAENRPILWMNGSIKIRIKYDRLCRRILKNEVKYIYKDFLQLEDSLGRITIWDPTETVRTRPLNFSVGSNETYYVHDGNENVSEVLSLDGKVKAHYNYSPFGVLDISNSYEDNNESNFLRFSSEYYDKELGMVYYNFRSFNPSDGRWIGRDPGEELFSLNLYGYVNNRPIEHNDWLGLSDCRELNSDFSLTKTFDGLGGAIGSFSISYKRSIKQRNCYVKCEDCSIGYTIERDVLDGAGGGMSWNLPISGIPTIVTVPLSVSYTLSGGERYYYNSCTKEEKTDQCNKFSLSGSIGAAVGVGRFITYSISGGVSYEWSDCDEETSNLNFEIFVEQCYFGQCWSVVVRHIEVKL